MFGPRTGAPSECRPRPRARFHLALAKLYEHKIKDFELALLHAQRTTEVEGAADRDHRVARVMRKLDKRRRQIRVS